MRHGQTVLERREPALEVVQVEIALVRPCRFMSLVVVLLSPSLKGAEGIPRSVPQDDATAWSAKRTTPRSR